MPRVIAEPCVGVKDAACVEVCPVDCIHPTPAEPGYAEAAQLYIDPNECIDCAACEADCPVQAIFPDDELPEKWHGYVRLNEEWFDKR